jgi:Domain of unknown function (DUF4878)
MKWSRLPAVLTALFVCGLFAFLCFRGQGWKLPSFAKPYLPGSSRSASTPEDTVYDMLDAARSGNSAQYLDSFSGPLQQQIQQTIRESGKPQFATYLASQSARFQSVAVSISDQRSDLEARVRVEYIYTNKNEIQIFHLAKQAGRWKITGISSTDQIRTLIPFGTAVTDD